jgi:hypothetical protein
MMPVGDRVYEREWIYVTNDVDMSGMKSTRSRLMDAA